MYSLESNINNFSNIPANQKLYSVKKPSSNNPVDIRNEVLRKYFGFTDNEVKELTKSFNNEFVISNARNNKWITVSEVVAWKADIKGEVSVVMTEKVANNIKFFRENLIKGFVVSAVSNISDLTLRATVFQDLCDIINSFDQIRIKATSDLINDVSSSLKSADEIHKTISYLIHQVGYQNNPFLSLVNAYATAKVYKERSGPDYDSPVLNFLSDTTRTTSQNFIFGDSMFPASNINRSEASFINRNSAYLYNQMGKNKEFLERDWMARFYDISEEERNALKEGDTIEFISSFAPNAIGTPRPLSNNEVKLEQLKIARNEEIERQEKLDKIGSQVVPTDHRNDEYFQKKGEGTLQGSEFENVKNRNPKNSQGKRNYSPKVKIVESKSFNPYSNANVKVNGVGAALDLPNKFVKYVITLKRLEELTAYLQQRETLVRQIRNEYKYIVPPKPETIKLIKERVNRFGRTLVGENEKLQVRISLEGLDRLWEESNVFWGSKK